MCINVTKYSCGVEEHHSHETCSCPKLLCYLPLTRHCDTCLANGNEESTFLKLMQIVKPKQAGEEPPDDHSTGEREPIPDTEPRFSRAPVGPTLTAEQVVTGYGTVYVKPASKPVSIIPGRPFASPIPPKASSSSSSSSSSKTVLANTLYQASHLPSPSQLYLLIHPAFQLEFSQPTT
jgi:hypothetical protein